MKTREQIEQRLADTRQRYDENKAWNDEMHKKYVKEVTFWGSGDKTDIDVSARAMREAYNDIKLLKWILDDLKEL